jgi:hypothetical protein
MRVSAFRGTLTWPNGHKSLEPPEAPNAVKPTSPEPLDEEIESLLVSLDQAPIEAGPAAPDASQASLRPREYPPAHRRRPRFPRVNQFDLFFVLTAVVLGFAVGLLTVFLVNG